MPKAAFLIAGSPNPAFYSQIAAISLNLRSLPWNNWSYSIHAFFGGEYSQNDQADLERWIPYLQDVEITRVSQESYAKNGNWAQCDALMLSAPRDADVLVALDADTLPVAGFEQVLNHVLKTKSIAGVIAHFIFPGAKSPEDWNAIAKTLINKPLDFQFKYTLVGPTESEARRQAPFYLNGGVVFYSSACFSEFVDRYFNLRKRLMKHMEATDFSSQVATTLACADLNIPTCALPMRFNYPNDIRADQLHPGEQEKVIFYHYLRTNKFNRQEIFTSSENYENFISLDLSGPNRRFQQAVRESLGEQFPFVNLSK